MRRERHQKGRGEHEQGRRENPEEMGHNAPLCAFALIGE
jgi:hypothetical protein